MKKFIGILLSLCIAVSLTACGNSQEVQNSTSDENIPDNIISSEETDVDKSVICTISPWGLKTKPMRAVEGCYAYDTICYDDPAKETTGRVMITDYNVSVDSENPEYEIKTVTALLTFDDPNAQTFGMYYNILCNSMESDTFYKIEDTYTVTVDGKEYDIELLHSVYSREEWVDHEYYAEYTVSYRVPAGYDELAMVFYNSKHRALNYGDDNELKDGTPIANVIDDNTNWFILGSMPSEDIWYNDSEYRYTPMYNGSFYETEPFYEPEVYEPVYNEDFDVDAKDHAFDNYTETSTDGTIKVSLLSTNQDYVDKNNMNWICANYSYEGTSDKYEIVFEAYGASRNDLYYTYSSLLPGDHGSCSFDFEINGSDITGDELHLTAAILPKAGNGVSAIAETTLTVR